MYDVEYSLLNSNGIDLQNAHSSVSLSTEITMVDTIKGTKEFSNGYEGQEYTHFSQVRPEPIFDSALEKAQKGLLKSKIPIGTYPIVLSPEAVELLFLRTIANAINGLAIYEKRSFMRNKLDKQIASEKLEITDDPWLEGGINTCAWDGEGTPTHPLKIIKNGILETYLHNVYSANLFETLSTGHGSRSLHSTSIGISPSNLKISPGNEDFNSMIEDIKKGVLLDASYDRPNFVTGEFSGLISSGFLIENGEIKHALRESTMGFNIFEFYNNITSIGKTIYRRGGNYIPHIKVKNVKISAKE
jgi:PmbA protein